VKDSAGGHGSHVSHTEDLLALELLFDVGDDVEIVLIGGKKVFEAGILQAEDLVDILFGGLGLGSQPFSKDVYYFQHDGGGRRIFLDLSDFKAF